MQTWLLRLFGHRLFHKSVGVHTGNGGALDLQFGFALLRDRRVPFGSKLLALGLGGALVALLITLELPLEALLAVVLPVLGFVPDAIVDGAEAVVGPVVVAALLLPRLAPAAVVEAIRGEHTGHVFQHPPVVSTP